MKLDAQLAMLFPKQQAPYKIELLNNESVDTLKNFIIVQKKHF